MSENFQSEQNHADIGPSHVQRDEGSPNQLPSSMPSVAQPECSAKSQQPDDTTSADGHLMRQGSSCQAASHLVTDVGDLNASKPSKPLELTESNLERHLRATSMEKSVPSITPSREQSQAKDEDEESATTEQIFNLLRDFEVEKSKVRSGYRNKGTYDLSVLAGRIDEDFIDMETRTSMNICNADGGAWAVFLQSKRKAIVQSMVDLEILFDRYNEDAPASYYADSSLLDGIVKDSPDHPDGV